MAEKHRGHNSQRQQKYHDASPKKSHREARESVLRRRAHAPHRPAPRTGCHDPEVRKGIGAVLFALGVLVFVAGVVMTAVSANDKDGDARKYPASFSAVGPLLIVAAVICVVTGLILSSPALTKDVVSCFSFNDPNGFCRVHCPRVSHFLKPDETILFNQSAMRALQTQPGKSAIKRAHSQPPPVSPVVAEQPDDEVFSGVNGNNSSDSSNGSANNGKPLLNHVSEIAHNGNNPRARLGSRGVRFSDSESVDFRDARTHSVSSQSSVLTLKNCKVYPKDGIWFTDGQDQETSEVTVIEENISQLTTDL